REPVPAGRGALRRCALSCPCGAGTEITSHRAGMRTAPRAAARGRPALAQSARGTKGRTVGMDRRYEAYCLADPYFYDHPALREDLAPAFPQVRRPAPAGWSAGPNGDWWHLLPDGHGLPEQGWKIHVSATPQDAERVLDLVWETCAGAGLPFKFLRSRGLLFLRNSKYAERGGS